MCLQTCILFRTQVIPFDDMASKMHPVLPGQLRAFILSNCATAIAAYSVVTVGLTQGRIAEIWHFYFYIFYTVNKILVRIISKFCSKFSEMKALGS